MALLFRDRLRRPVPALCVLTALLCLTPGFAATLPAGKIEFSFDGTLTGGGTGQVTTVAGELATITQSGVRLITAAKAQGSWTDTLQDSRWILSGKVHIESDKVVLDADTATVVFANGLIQSIEVHGKPAKFSRPGEKTGQLFNGTADTITFDGARREVRFTGPSWFSQRGVGEGNSGKPLVYNIDSNALRSEPGSEPDAPIHVLFGEEKQIAGRFDGSFSLGIGDDTVAGELVTITQADGTLITAKQAQGHWSGTVADSRWTLSGAVHVEHEKVVMDADAATIQFANRLIQSIEVRGTPGTVSSTVHIEFEKAVMDADTATVQVANRLIQSIEVHGTPARFSHPGKVADRPYTGTSDAITYDGTKRLVRFTGRTWFSYGPGEATSGKPLIYDINTSAMRSEKSPDTPPIKGTLHKDRIPTPSTPDRSSAQ